MSLPNDIGNNDRPKTPAAENCCGNGCNPCIFDVHKKLLKEWEKERFNTVKKTTKNFLSLIQYKKFIVKSSTESSEDCIIVQLDCSSDNDNIIFLLPTQHIMMKLVCATKPYTPISWHKSSMKLLIKLYSNSQTSDEIKQLKIDDEIFIRGPYGDFKYIRNSYKNIVMLSIGSGIAVFYPLAASIVEDELEDTRINMMLGFRSLSHVPLKSELRLLADYWNFECTLCLSKDSKVSITGLNISNSRLDEKIIDETLNSYSPESTLVLICGTLEFNKTVQNFVQKKQFSHHHVFS